MDRVRGLLRLLGVGLLVLASAATRAGEVAPEVRRALAADPGKPLAVIVTLADRVDSSLYRQDDRRRRDGRLVRALRDKAAVTQAPLRAFLRARGLPEAQELWIVNGLALALPAALVEPVAAFPGVAAVRIDGLAEAPPATAGEAAPAEWNLAAIGAPGLWGAGHAGAGIVVASMDTGVDAQHPELGPKWRGGPGGWFDPHGQHAEPYDASGHGTQAAALMVGGAGSGAAIGVAPAATWIAVKLFDDAGLAAYSDIHRAFQWLLDPDGDPASIDAPDVVNASWGLVGTAGQCIDEFESDIAILRDAGIGIALAAGNDGPAPATSLSPANNPSGFAVGAVDAALAVATFSARGPSACSGALYPHLVAPGVAVRTADLSFGGLASYTNVTGTSYAAPHVAGAIALLMGAFPWADVPAIEEALQRAALDVAAPGADDDSGFGLLDAYAAFLLLGGGSSPPSITSLPPTQAIEGQPYVYAVAAYDPLGGALAFALDAAPAGMTIDASGLVTWTPATGQAGSHAVSIRATNGAGLSATQSYTVVVARAKSAPVAVDDAAAAPVRKRPAYAAVSIDVAANDTDADGDLDRDAIAIESAPDQGGMATPQPGGTVAYVPRKGFRGTERFTYRIRDAAGAVSNAARVEVTVR